MPTRNQSPLRSTMWLLLVMAFAVRAGYAKDPTTAASAAYPPELVDWSPRPENPVFTAAGPGHWDVKIRERGWILRDGDTYHLWFTGYDGTRAGIKQLGYATSPDGLRWTSAPQNPLCRGHWIEDVMVVQHGGTHYMFAEGPDEDIAQMLTSFDRVHWKFTGVLDIRYSDGKRRVKKPCGTPTVWVENGVWYLFYERGDLGVWLATARDPLSLIWINLHDAPVLALGPDNYDREQIAVNQIIKHRGAYYALYHASGDGDPPPRTWSTNIARSDDLVLWKKFPGNPIVGGNKSSGILVPTGGGFRLYTMHDQIDTFESPRK